MQVSSPPSLEELSFFFKEKKIENEKNNGNTVLCDRISTPFYFGALDLLSSVVIAFPPSTPPFRDSIEEEEEPYLSEL